MSSLFRAPLIAWAALHLVQVLAGAACLRRLRGRWAWAAAIVSGVASAASIAFLLLVFAELWLEIGIMESQLPVLGAAVGEAFVDVLRWISLPGALIGLALDPAVWRRPLSFVSRLAGAAGVAWVLWLAH